MEEDTTFSDEGIFESKLCLVQQQDGTTTGISILLNPNNPEIILTYAELLTTIERMRIFRKVYKEYITDVL